MFQRILQYALEDQTLRESKDMKLFLGYTTNAQMRKINVEDIVTILNYMKDLPDNEKSPIFEILDSLKYFDSLIPILKNTLKKTSETEDFNTTLDNISLDISSLGFLGSVIISESHKKKVFNEFKDLVYNELSVEKQNIDELSQQKQNFCVLNKDQKLITYENKKLRKNIFFFIFIFLD